MHVDHGAASCCSCSGGMRCNGVRQDCLGGSCGRGNGVPTCCCDRCGPASSLLVPSSAPQGLGAVSDERAEQLRATSRAWTASEARPAEGH